MSGRVRRYMRKNIYQGLIIYFASGIKGLPQETGENVSPPLQCCTNSDFLLMQQALVSIRHQITACGEPVVLSGRTRLTCEL